VYVSKNHEFRYIVAALDIAIKCYIEPGHLDFAIRIDTVAVKYEAASRAIRTSISLNTFRQVYERLHCVADSAYIPIISHAHSLLQEGANRNGDPALEFGLGKCANGLGDLIVGAANGRVYKSGAPHDEEDRSAPFSSSGLGRNAKRRLVAGVRKE
jgi:hypothetical protein